jgi:ssDNA-binding Zn-finger/Zn-ribbon topoisomerase 1
MERKKKRPLSMSHNLAACCPEAAAHWHMDLNEDRPEDVTPGSNKKRWWRCLEDPNHEPWQQSVNVLARGPRCPTCAGKRFDPKNSLAVKAPWLIAEWHPEKNGGITPWNTNYGSRKNVWWRCEAWSHEWEAMPNNRTAGGSGCPKCRPATSRIELAIAAELLALFPNDAQWRQREDGRECDVLIRRLNIAVEVDGYYWHVNREEQDRAKGHALAAGGIHLLRVRDHRLDRLTAENVIFRGQEPYPAICMRVARALASMMNGEDRLRMLRYADEGKLLGGEWFRMAVRALPGPPPGQSLADIDPDLSSEWDAQRNGAFTPAMMWPASSFRAFWSCKVCGHGWPTSINARFKGRTGCPQCSGTIATPAYNFTVLFPNLMQEWDFDANREFDPFSLLPYSNAKVNWRCSKDPSHRWLATIGNRTGLGTGCPHCRFVSLAEHSPQVAAEWHPRKNSPDTPDTVSYGSKQKRWWLCHSCQHEWPTTPNSRTSAATGRGCPNCAGKIPVPGATLGDLHPIVAADLSSDNVCSRTGTRLTAFDLQPWSNMTLLWRCKAGHERWSVVQARVRSGGCPDCRHPYKNQLACLPATRDRAKATGSRYYLTGRPCQRGGHVAPRLVGNKNCTACNKERSMDRYFRRKLQSP